MPLYSCWQLDAFTDCPFQGNPCAVVFDAGTLMSHQMQLIAREMNLSETVFLLPRIKADFRARYFTPAVEIPMAGHPTIALTQALIESGLLMVDREPLTFTLELPAGIIPVHVEPQDTGQPWITMTQQPPEFLRCYDAAAVLPCFGLPASAARSDCPIQTVSTGVPQLMIALQNMSDLQDINVDQAALRALVAQGDFFSVHLFCMQGATPAGSTFARHFVPPPNSFEDPFTGSATGGMAAFAWHYGLLAQPKFVAEQGHWLGRAGQARVTVHGDRQQPQSVQVGGQAVNVMRGDILVRW